MVSPVTATRIICATRLPVSRWYWQRRAMVSKLVNARSMAPRRSSTCRKSCIEKRLLPGDLRWLRPGALVLHPADRVDLCVGHRTEPRHCLLEDRPGRIVIGRAQLQSQCFQGEPLTPCFQFSLQPLRLWQSSQLRHERNCSIGPRTTGSPACASLSIDIEWYRPSLPP